MIDRRRFLAFGATAPSALRAAASGEDGRTGLRLEYEVSAPPTVPPPIALDSPPRLVVDFAETARGRRCSIGLRVALDGEPGLLPLALWTGEKTAYWHARETLRLPAFRGAVVRTGERWSLSVGGRASFSARTGSPVDGTAPPAQPLPWITYRYILEPDWRRGPLGADPAELWLLRGASGPVSAALRAESCHAEGDFEGWLARLGASGPVAASITDAPAEAAQEHVRAMDPAALQPFALRTYGGASPLLQGLDTPHLSPDEIEAYRQRREVRLANLLLVTVDAAADRTAVESVLPPPCVAPQSPVVRVLTIRGLENPALDEAWLFAACSLHNQRYWYAVSHLRAALAGTAFGREVLGYPTDQGAVTGMLGASRFAASVGQGGRSLFHAAGFYGGFSTGTSLAELPVASLRLRPGPSQGSWRGEIVTQPWYYQGLRRPVRREGLVASFPAPGSGGRTSSWSRFGAARAHWASIFDNATMQRLPGTVAAEVENVAPYYRDRCDGRLPWEEPLAGETERGPS